MMMTPNRLVSICARKSVSCIFNWAHITVAGIVHEHVQDSEGCNRRSEGRLGLHFIAHIERDSTNLPGVSALKLDKLLRITGCRDHAISRLKCCFCERTAEAARSTGNEPHPIGR